MDDTILLEERIELLNLHVTPVLKKLGLENVKHNAWLSEENSLGIRKMVKYQYAKGRATIVWGICLTFMPIPSGKKLKYQRTNSSADFHLFESADEFKYYTNLSINDTDKGSIYHQRHRFENDLIRVINEEMPAITSWFERADTIDGLIEIAEEQISKNWFTHYPSLHYVLAFLYAKKGNWGKALEYLHYCLDYEAIQNHEDKLKEILLKIYTSSPFTH